MSCHKQNELSLIQGDIMRTICLYCGFSLFLLALVSCSPAPDSHSTSTAKTNPQTAEDVQWTPMAASDYPDPPEGLPEDLPSTLPVDEYVAFAWNDLGMHCYQGEFSSFLILPPYNVYWSQVVRREEKPVVITDGLQVRYVTHHVSHPELHSNFWDYASAYGWDLDPGEGLTGAHTSGYMEAKSDHFIAEGVPTVDYADDGTWDPFPMFLVSVKDDAGTMLAQTLNVAPTSTEMACDLCHQGGTFQESMRNVLQTHDKYEETDLLASAEEGRPVICCSCHSDPAMGFMENKDCELSLSAAMHGFHADKINREEFSLPKNACHSCHPGPNTNCLRDVMSQYGITCTHCHGEMATVGAPERTPWVNLPSCTSCHSEALDAVEAYSIRDPNEHLTPTADSLYRNSKAHGGVYCAACHGSPHAVTPASRPRDNEQAIRLQAESGPISKCTLCHMEQPEEEFQHFYID
jgi:hypothetical protein